MLDFQFWNQLCLSQTPCWCGLVRKQKILRVFWPSSVVLVPQMSTIHCSFLMAHGVRRAAFIIRTAFYIHLNRYDVLYFLRLLLFCLKTLVFLWVITCVYSIVCNLQCYSFILCISILCSVACICNNILCEVLSEPVICIIHSFVVWSDFVDFIMMD